MAKRAALAENEHFYVRELGPKEIESAAKVIAATRKNPEGGGFINEELEGLEQHYKRMLNSAKKSRKSLLLGLYDKSTNKLAGVAGIAPLDVFGERYSVNIYRLLREHLGEKTPAQRTVGFLFGLGVKAEHENKSGAKVLTEVREQFANGKFGHLVLDTQNPKIKHIYSSRGYTHLGSFGGVVTPGITWHVYHKQIK